MTTADLIVGGAAAALVLGVWCVALGFWSVKRRKRQDMLRRRLQVTLAPERSAGRELRLWHDGQATTTTVPLTRTPTALERLEQMRQDIRLPISLPAAALATVGLVAAVAGATWMATANPIVAGAGGAIVVFVAWTVVRAKLSKAAAVFDQQLVDALELAARSLRAGHPLLGAFRVVAEETSAPVSVVFADICQQQAMGMGLEEALRQAAARTASDDLKLFATSVIIQIRSGGNLADMMERVSAVIRDRIRLGRRVRVLTAQTQMSKRILLVLPVGMLLLLSCVNAAYMEPLYSTTAGRWMLGLAAGGLLLGAWLMNRLSVLK